jgi:hypothetical protein
MKKEFDNSRAILRWNDQLVDENCWMQTVKSGFPLKLNANNLQTKIGKLSTQNLI